MDETEWLSSSHLNAPDKMLAWLGEKQVARRAEGRRKLRLFACACCRWIWEMLRSQHRFAVKAAERFADGLIAKEVLARAAVAASRTIPVQLDYNGQVAVRATEAACRPIAMEAAYQALMYSYSAWARYPHTPGASDPRKRAEIESVQSAALRCIFGNPFRPLALSPACRTPTIVALAHAAYEERVVPRGELNPIRLGVFADALEEAGASGELVDHLRGPGPHWLGCHVVEMIRKKP